jgi:hypothetical protein
MSSGELPKGVDLFDERQRAPWQTLAYPTLLINLGFLMALKEAVVRDPVQASYQFRLHRATPPFRDLGFDAPGVARPGLDESIVTLRYTGQDLCDLIKTPPALRNIFASVRELVEPMSARPSPSSR